MSTLSRYAAARPSARAESRRRRSLWIHLGCETLEHRQLLSASAMAGALGSITAQTSLQLLPSATPAAAALTPQQIQNAYGINRIAFSGGGVSGNGAGQTIAIVDAYNDPNVRSDLAAFDSQYGLAAPPSFTIANLGATTTDPGWALETALDVEWAHAVAPRANIVLVEAASATLSGLLSAVRYASAAPGVSVVSMSWGTNEFYGEWNDISAFTTPAGHNSVAFVAASGDQGAWSGPMFPSVSPNVLAVGGTTLSLASGSAYGSETGWSGSTGGFSGLDNGYQYGFTAPSYQTATLTAAGLNFGIRTTPDVSFNASPTSGVSVYDSVAYNGQAGWFQIGGTSAAAPAWAALIAITDQGLATAGKGSLSTSQVLSDLYSLPSTDFHDITSGFNGYSATTGYDLVTGLGSPRADRVIAGLLAANGVSESSAATKSTATAPASLTTSSAERLEIITTPGTGSGSGSGSSSPSGSGSNSSGSGATSVALSLTISANSSAIQVLEALPVQSPSTQLNPATTQSGPQNAATVPPPVQGATAPPSLGQSLIQSNVPSAWKTADPPEPPRIVDVIEPMQSSQATPPDQLVPADEPAREPAPPDGPSAPAPPALDFPKGDFDEMLPRLRGSLLVRRIAPVGIQAALGEEVPTSRPALGASALAGIAAVAAGYRFVLRQSADQKRRQWWSSRFPTS
jgi:hypothetical protein